MSQNHNPHPNTRKEKTLMEINFTQHVGQPVAITFLDHAAGDGDTAPFACLVHGILGLVESDYIRVDTWVTLGDDAPENRDSVAILISAISDATIYPAPEPLDQLQLTPPPDMEDERYWKAVSEGGDILTGYDEDDDEDEDYYVYDEMMDDPTGAWS